MSVENARRWLRGCDQPLAEAYDVALLDLDGVVYVGPDPIPGVPQALQKARECGMRLAFVTNNASRAPETVAAHLEDLGIPASPSDVVTSSQAAATVIVERLGPGSSVLVTGSAALRDAIESAGLKPVSSADDRPDAVVQGFSADLCYADLVEATLAVRAGALWVATNVDSTLPSPRGLLPGNGSLVAVVAAAAGTRPLVAGKPELPLHAEAVRRAEASRPLVVGDRLDTDIEGANAADTDSLLVLTGVTSASDLVHAQPAHRPTYLAADLIGLLEPQPAVEVSGSRARSGGWSVNLDDGELRLDGEGRPVDGLRAVLAAAWSSEAGTGDVGAGVDASDALLRLGFA